MASKYPDQIEWSNNIPPISNPPKDIDSACKELEDICKAITGSLYRRAEVVVFVFHSGVYADDENPDHTLTNMSMWLNRNHNIHLTPTEIRSDILLVDVVSPFGPDAVKWIQQYPATTARYLASTAARLFEKTPNNMTPEELEKEKSRMDTFISSFPVSPKPLSKNECGDKIAKLVKEKFIPPMATKRGTTKPKDEENITIDDIDSEVFLHNRECMVDGMFIPRRVKFPGNTEQEMCDKFLAYCEQAGIGYDEAFRNIMNHAEGLFAISLKKAA